MALSEAEELELLQLQKAKAQSTKPMSGFDRESTIAGAIFNALPDSPATRIQKGLQGLGGDIAEKGGEIGGRAGFPKTGQAIGVGLGAIPTYLPTIMSMMSPEAEGSRVSMLKPNVPPARQAAVNAAKELNVPLTRAEQTGSMMGAGLESMLEKTPLGARPIQQFREGQSGALQAAKEGMQGKMGTSSDTFSVGQKALGGLEKRASAMKAAKNALFEQVPDNVRIEIPQAKNMADTLMNEQGTLWKGTRSPEVMRWSKIVSDAESSTGKGVTGGPEFKGVTRTIPGETIPPSTVTRQSSLLSESGKPISYQENIPGRTTKPRTEYGIKASVQPEETLAPKYNYYPIKKLRENLGEDIRAAKKAGKYQDYRDLSRLMDSLDKDISTFASKPASPMDSLIAKTFKENYKKANAFSGAYKGLYESAEADALRNTPPEKIVDTVFKKNNETAIKQFHAMVGEEGFQPAKQAFTQNILESKNVLNEIKKYKPGTLRAIYNQPELDQITKYGLAQSLSKGAEKMAGNPSGTGRQVASAGSYAGAGALAASGHPFLAGTLLGGPYAAAKGYLSNAARSGVEFNPQTNKGVASIVSALLGRMRSQNQQ
jgi:hypothetical protein